MKIGLKVLVFVSLLILGSVFLFQFPSSRFSCTDPLRPLDAAPMPSGPTWEYKVISGTASFDHAPRQAGNSEPAKVNLEAAMAAAFLGYSPDLQRDLETNLNAF